MSCFVSFEFALLVALPKKTKNPFEMTCILCPRPKVHCKEPRGSQARDPRAGRVQGEFNLFKGKKRNKAHQ